MTGDARSHGDSAKPLTKPQREWLARFIAEQWTVADIADGGTAQMITRLQNRGLLRTIPNKNWKLIRYEVTDAGRRALSEQK